ncbi:VOC family protein [Streptomyces sp. NPDC102365]|uniref:VOC family protein n=1 Tax=Streptomyces sp. NPDC102365 TaxID=3366162 RepID=UPI0037FC33D0
MPSTAESWGCPSTASSVRAPSAAPSTSWAAASWRSRAVPRNRPSPAVGLWLQVADVRAAYEELVAAGVEVDRPPVKEPWGLVEMWLTDPDGTRIAVVEVPSDHPLRYRP